MKLTMALLEHILKEGKSGIVRWLRGRERASKPDDLNLAPRTHMVEGEN